MTPLEKVSLDELRTFHGEAVDRISPIIKNSGIVSVCGKTLKVVGVYGFGGMGCAMATGCGRVLKLTTDHSEVDCWEKVWKGQKEEPSEFSGFARVDLIERGSVLSMILREDTEPLAMCKPGGMRYVSQRTLSWLGGTVDNLWSYNCWEPIYTRVSEHVPNTTAKKIAKLKSLIREIDGLEDVHTTIWEGNDDPIGLAPAMFSALINKYRSHATKLPSSIAGSLGKSLIAAVERLKFLPVDLNETNLGWRKERDEIVVFDMQGISLE